MVTIDPNSGEKDSELYTILAKSRMFGNKILFGIHLMHLLLPELIEFCDIQHRLRFYLILYAWYLCFF